MGDIRTAELRLALRMLALGTPFDASPNVIRAEVLRRSSIPKLPVLMNAFRTLFLTSVGFALLNTQALAADVLFTASITHDQETATGTLVTTGGDPRPL